MGIQKGNGNLHATFSYFQRKEKIATLSEKLDSMRVGVGEKLKKLFFSYLLSCQTPKTYRPLGDAIALISAWFGTYNYISFCLASWKESN